MELHVQALLQCLYTCTYCLLVTYEVFVVPKQMNSTVVISGTIGWLPPQCVAAQRQCCSPGRSQLLPPLTCSTSCSTDARKKINPSLKNPVTKKCLVFNRRKCRNRGEQIHIVSSHQQSADRQGRFHFTASFRIIIRTRPSTLFPHHFSCFHMGES